MRRWALGALVAFGVVLGVILGNLIFPSWDRDRSALQPYESSFLAGGTDAGSAPLFVNYVSQPILFAGDAGFSYWTGGLSRGTQAVSPPTRVWAVARQGPTQVELKADADAPGHSDLADVVARQIDVATRAFWPDDRLPVAVELHQVPENSRYEFARQITWREGRPFHLTLFIHDTLMAQQQAGIALHELYHVLATRWRLGSKSERGLASPWLGGLYEEVAASLLSDCGRLQLTTELTLPQRKSTLTLHGEDGRKTTYEGSLDRNGLAFILEPGRNFRWPPSLITDLMHRTALLEFVPEGESITAGTSRAEQLLTVCHDAVRDPWYLEGWFRGLAEREPTP